MAIESPTAGEAGLNAVRVGARGWNRIGLLLSLTIIAVAAVALYHTLHGIRVGRVMRALLATEPANVALAALCVACSYLTLTFYDLFALRVLGRSDIPYQVAMLGSFTSYAVGHNVGVSVFSGGAVRYRIYSAWGMDAIAVAKLCFLAGLTFWLGNATVLGLGIAYVPDAASAIDQLPAWLNRTAALLTLLVLVGYIAWVWQRPRAIGLRDWNVTLPSGPLTLLQVVIGILDLSWAALAMYVLLPSEPNIGFVTLAVIFVAATLLGFASHAPGGLGVFDAAMLVALLRFDRQELLAGMLLFRLLYYIAPFVLSLLILGGRELVLTVSARSVAKSEPAEPG